MRHSPGLRRVFVIGTRIDFAQRCRAPQRGGVIAEAPVGAVFAAVGAKR
ncbi:hypothetical protein [Streptomyces sp. NPDC020607]